MHVCISAPTAAHVAIWRPRALPFVFPSRCIDRSAASRSSDSPTRKSTLTLKPEKTFEEPNCLLTRAHSGGCAGDHLSRGFRAHRAALERQQVRRCPHALGGMPSSILALACSWSGTSAQRASSAQASETQRRRTSVRSRNEQARGALFESKRTRRCGTRAAASMTAQMLVPIVRPLSARTQLNWEIRPRLPMGDEAFFQSVSLCDEASAKFWPYVRARRACDENCMY